MTLSEVRKTISQAKGIVVYFKNDTCAPCKALRPKVEALINDQFPKMKFLMVDTVQEPLLSSEYNVFANPTILVFFEGREYIRKSKYIGIGEWSNEMNRLYTMVF